MAGDAPVGTKNSFAGFDTGGFNFEIAFESLMLGDDFAGDEFDRDPASSGHDSFEGKIAPCAWHHDLSELLVTEPVSEGGDAHIGELVSQEFRLRAFFGLGEVEEISDKAGAVVEGATSTFLFIAPIRIEIEEAALPGVENASFHGIENVGKSRSVIHRDGGGDDFHHLVFAGGIAT